MKGESLLWAPDGLALMALEVSDAALNISSILAYIVNTNVRDEHTEEHSLHASSAVDLGIYGQSHGCGRMGKVVFLDLLEDSLGS